MPTTPCHPELGLILCTNGLLLTQDRLTKIREAGKPLRGIEISVDAASADTYAENRRGGSWNKLLINLTALAKTEISLRLNFVVQANNFREMPEFVDLAKSFGISQIRFDALSDWGTFGPQELASRSVHLPTHPLHDELLVVLRDPKLRDPRVRMARLSDDYFNTLDSRETIWARQRATRHGE